MYKNISNKLKENNKKGFTLIEILIVVVIIGVLSGLMLRVINVGDVRKKTQDSQRIADLKKIQTALELYFVDNRTYPVSANWTDITGTDSISNLLKNNNYINQIPTDPKAATVGDYKYKSSGGVYYLISAVELSTTNLCTESNPYGAGLGCYEVQNPL